MTLAGLFAALIVGWWWANQSPVRVPTPSLTPSLPAPPPVDTRPAEVVKVIDGDTLDARLGGRRVRLRLLNVDAPETAHNGQAADCLADQATVRLRELAPPGSRLRVSEHGVDRFGRILGGLYTSGGELINARLVADGLAAPMVVNRQTDLIKPVREAQSQAATLGAGLHGETECTVPGQVRAAELAVADLVGGELSAPTAGKRLTQADRIRGDLTELGQLLGGGQRFVPVDALTRQERDRLQDRLAEAKRDLNRFAAQARELA